MAKIGAPVMYVDQHSHEHVALVTQNWGDESGTPAINLVYVNKNAGHTDQYGQQTLHETSVVHQSSQSAPGRYWYEFINLDE